MQENIIWLVVSNIFFLMLHSQKWVIHIDPPIVVKLIVTNHPRELSRPGWKHLNPRFMSSILQHRICSIDSRASSPIETNQTWESSQTSSNIPTFSIHSQIFPRFSWQFPVVRSPFSLHHQSSVFHQVMAPFASVPIVVRLGEFSNQPGLLNSCDCEQHDGCFQWYSEWWRCMWFIVKLW